MESARDLKCNTCWVSLAGDAFIAACSHLFCANCVRKHFRVEFKCPCCHQTLPRDGIVQVDLSTVSDGYLPYGQPPAVALATAAKVIAFWEFQRSIQDERRKELLKRERDEKEDLNKRFRAETSRISSDMAGMQAENKRLKQKESDSERVADDLRSKVSHLTRSKRKLHELYCQLKNAWQQQHGDFPDHLLREEAFIEEAAASLEESPLGQSVRHHMQPSQQLLAMAQQQQQQQQQGSPLASTPQQHYQASPLLVPLASRAINSPLMRGPAAVSPFARLGVASPQKKALLPVASPAPSTPIFNVQSTAPPAPSPAFSGASLPPPPVGNSLFARFQVGLQSTGSMRPNSLMEAAPPKYM